MSASETGFSPIIELFKIVNLLTRPQTRMAASIHSWMVFNVLVFILSLFTCSLGFRYETGHDAIGDGGAYPYFGQQEIGILVFGFEIDVEVVE